MNMKAEWVKIDLSFYHNFQTFYFVNAGSLLLYIAKNASFHKDPLLKDFTYTQEDYPLAFYAGKFIFDLIREFGERDTRQLEHTETFSPFYFLHYIPFFFIVH